MEKRMRELLEAAEDSFNNLEDPFSHSWLSHHDVGSGECIELSRMVAVAICEFLERNDD